MILPGQMYCMHQLNLRPNLMEPVPWSCSNSIGPSQPRHLARHTHNHKYMHTHSGRVHFCLRTGQFPTWKVYSSSRSWHPLADKILIRWIYWRCCAVCRSDSWSRRSVIGGLAKCISCLWRCIASPHISSRPMHLLLLLPLHHNCTHLGMHQLDSENSRACCEFITDRQYIQIRLFCAARLVVEWCTQSRNTSTV